MCGWIRFLILPYPEFIQFGTVSKAVAPFSRPSFHALPPGSAGRQSFLFYQGLERWRKAGFLLFQGLPFLYELRVLLDWACTETSLTLYKWFKLEDVRASLYSQQHTREAERRRPPGTKVPGWDKFLQVTTGELRRKRGGS